MSGIFGVVSQKEILAQGLGVRITKLEIYSLAIAEKARPGQFVVVMPNEVGERIPLTIVDKDTKQGTITLVFQEVGLTTKLLGRLSPGDSLYALVGPLGCPTEIKNYGRLILVGGGVGAAEIYPVAKTLKKIGNHITTILGARTKELLILTEELRGVSDEIHITTDDGSCGKKGFTTDILEERLKSGKYDLVYSVGPIVMMKRVSRLTQGFKIKTIASLNPLMVDATGMCGCCRVTISGKTRFSCVDGPEFDAHLVDWEELENRNRLYLDKEKEINNVKESADKTPEVNL